MKEKILKLLEKEKYLDGIDIAIKLNIPIDKTYVMLDELEKKNKVSREYSGIRSFYSVKNEETKQILIDEWIQFDFNKLETCPTKYGIYTVLKTRGIDTEIWNGASWAKNPKEIIAWRKTIQSI